MATLFKPTRPYPLPANAEVVPKDDKPHVRLKERGKAVFHPLTEGGTQYLKPGAKWAADVRFADGKRKRVRFSPSRDAAAVMLADLLKKIENEKAGVVDRFADHRKRPLTEHLDDWEKSLEASGRDEEYITLKPTRARYTFRGCGWVHLGDMTADRLGTFLLDLREKQERSVQTSNDWLQAVRQFVRWVISNERLDRDPFARLKPGNAKLNPCRRRGEFTVAEIGKFLDTAASSTTKFRGLAGTDRWMLYRVALGTGFRAAELAALVPDYFDLDSNPPTVILPAEFTKNRKGAVQPLSIELANEVRTFLKSKGRKEPLWPGKWADRSADMLKLDLNSVGIPVKIDGPEGDEVRDFHALRNCYISDVLRTGADLKQAMTLARHSDPRLTASRYARTRLHDLGSVVNKLPKPTTAPNEPAVLRLTGTDGGCIPDVPPDVPTGGNGRVRLRTSEETNTIDLDKSETLTPLVFQGCEGNRGLLKTPEAERGGFEPPVGFYPHAALAKRCFRPLSHLSECRISRPFLHFPRRFRFSLYYPVYYRYTWR